MLATGPLHPIQGRCIFAENAARDLIAGQAEQDAVSRCTYARIHHHVLTERRILGAGFNCKNVFVVSGWNSVGHSHSSSLSCDNLTMMGCEVIRHTAAITKKAAEQLYVMVDSGVGRLRVWHKGTAQIPCCKIVKPVWQFSRFSNASRRIESGLVLTLFSLFSVKPTFKTAICCLNVEGL